MSAKWLLVLAGVLALCLPAYLASVPSDLPPASAAPSALQSTLPAVADAWIGEGIPSSQLGGDPVMQIGFVDYGPGTTEERGLVRFDFGTVPLGSTVSSAVLRLYQSNVDSSPPPG